METSHRNFTEKTTDRAIASADERSSAIIARTALRRVMAESDSLYHNPADTGWVQNKIQTFKDNLRSQITLSKTVKESHWPSTYAKMLREELEYVELCIEYNDKTGHLPSEPKKKKSKDKGIVIASHDISESKPTPKPTPKPTKVIGHIDLNTPDSKPEWDKEQ